MIERFVGLEEAYKKRKRESEYKITNKKGNMKVYIERKSKGICVTCGKRETKKGFINCYKCRLKRRKYERRRTEKKLKEFLKMGLNE